ncbi:hypothetical protein PHYBOEH_009854 [Phytophthora boehmeriae]|uniref:FYVE-type domain-containing protein n=1 Tax=Phytophthora boehmeriae TaxID=109152 RepID=A0A8T1VVM6_9STRA|nr:hypothetical protein PHYBOEH_009854 [Phytophthora boehmeriae]
MSSSQSTLQLGNAEGFRHLAHSIVSRTLAVEVEYDRMGRPGQDDQVWKMIKRQNLLRAYKHKTRDVAQLDQSRSSGPSKKPPLVICVGSVEGTVEDILYGMHAKNRSEMGATTTFMNRKPLDCDVLAVLDSGSDKDPFRHLSIKYLLTETFGDARVVSNRDLCAVQSMGFGLDSRGERYGYYLLRSVNIPECSPLPADSDVVRANITMCCIYRQSKSSNSVHVYSKAMVDLGGSLPGFMAYDVAAELLLSTAEAMTSATAKRLTLLALRHRKAVKTRAPEELSSCSESDVHLLSSRYSRSFNFRSTKSFSSNTSEESACQPQTQQAKLCSICNKKPAMAKLVGSAHRNCGICAQCVCTKCSVKQRLYARSDQVAVACCKVCMLAAKQLSVDPRDPCPMLP